MTTTDTTLDARDERTENDTIVETAQAATTPQPIGERDENRFYAVTTPAGGTTKVIDLDELREALNPFPHRKRGTVTVRDADSLTAYIERHAAGATEVWADRETARVVAVLNSHAATLAGHGDHRAVLVLRKTPAWAAWEKLNGTMVAQGTFAEHIEDRQVDVVEPKPADMLEVVQTFQAAKKVDFESGHRLSSGEVVLEYRETLNATAGKKGQLTIPERFTLALIPFEGSAAYRVTARLRYRITEGLLRIGYALDRPEDVLENAFTDVVDAVAAGLQDSDVPLFYGTPQ